MRWRIVPESAEPLRDQIARAVRQGIAAGELALGDPLPPAVELGEALGVDRNTVLAAYRLLRDAGVLEFRRGRGVRVARADRPEAVIVEAIAELVRLGRRHGVDRDGLARLVRELP